MFSNIKRVAVRQVFGHKYGILRSICLPNNNVKNKSTLSPYEVTCIKTFRNHLPNVIELLAKNKKFAQVPQWPGWIQKIMEYNLTGGNALGGLITVHTYQALAEPETITRDSMMRALDLGWCLEMTQTFVILIDDMMDGAAERRGKPCWHTLPGVGIRAMNDALMMYGSVFELLNTNFSECPRCADMVNVFVEATITTGVGQQLDCSLQEAFKCNPNEFTMDRYNNSVKFKSHSVFHMPVLLGYLLTNNPDDAILPVVNEICVESNRLLQIQNDMCDVYGTEATTGRQGNDIEEGQCTWLAVTALQTCDESQRAIFIQNYGQKDPIKVQNIKTLYNQIDMKELFRREEILIKNRIEAKTKKLLVKYAKLMMKLMNNDFLIDENGIVRGAF